MSTQRHGDERDTWDGLAQARREAARRGDRWVGTQHLLLALLARPEGEAQRVLRDAGVTRVQCELALAGLHGPTAPATHTDPRDVDVARRAQVLLDRAARTTAGGGITDEALLAVLLVDDDPGLARTVLNYLGVGRGLARVLTRQP
ncbi:Clp protease N-terminal domain-containing protein [Actinomycetospora cinnamomea]|uniref:ClpA/ClpB-like protein n=1 Tax=Actinomycetospora cinnamomea TaxID=663609 RepID=A0A2U1EYY4_9PSEU|nr:Clp protease N-terminal domain-containing protein [Actinomycetospora cinnamomea]PVZ04950.1 ClpA/ClpB-like protein [Actinomycetospora cinnamomea]